MYLSLSVLFLSASVLSFEVIVIKLLAISHWQPFVTLSISTALLGFGISGSILMRTRGRAFSGIHLLYPGLALLAALLYRPVIFATSNLRLDPGLIIRDPAQWLRVGLLVAVLTIPFVLASGALALPLFERESVGRYYGWNLVGAAGGVAVALVAIGTLDPAVLPKVPSALAGLATLLAIFHFHKFRIRIVFVVTGILCVSVFYPSSPLSYGPYKDISYALLLPSARVVAQISGVTGKFQVVGAPAIRSASGLSTRYRGALPRQGALYRDGDRTGTLLLAGDQTRASLQYLRWQTAAAPYILLKPGVQIAVAGFDGGEEAARAMLMGASHVTMIEPDGSLKRMIDDNPDWFEPWLFESGSTLLTVDSVRSHFSRKGGSYDLIVYPPGVNLAAATAGLTGTAEGYETTVEGIEEALTNLKEAGMVSLTGWNQYPPTGRLKILNLLRKIPSINPDGHFARRVYIVTGWSTHTVLVRLEPLVPAEFQRLQEFSDARGFDLVDGDFFRTTADPGNGDEIELWERDLDLRPPTDNRPYPWHSLKISYLRHMVGRGREAAFPRVEWGFFFLIMVFTISTAISALALAVTKPARENSPGLPFTLYFGCLGVGYMALEILFIKRCLLVSGPAAVTSGLILVSFLLGSGLGSHISGRFAGRPSFLAGVFMAIPVLASLTFLVIPKLLVFETSIRAVIFVLGILPLAFLMGIPFPSALTLHFHGRESVVPWAWAITGYTSVVGSSLSGVLAITHGLVTLLILGGACYLLAGLLFMGMIQKQAMD